MILEKNITDLNGVAQVHIRNSGLSGKGVQDRLG